MPHFTDPPVAYFADWLLPSHWASALINDDWTGYEQDEIGQIDTVLFRSGLRDRRCVGVADDASFMQRPSYWPESYGLLAGDYATFTFDIS